jgi:hypothetical protein
MKLGFLGYLLKKLAQSKRTKAEMQHNQDAMKHEEVIT